MDILNTENYQSRIKELFKSLSSDVLYYTWADTFSIDVEEKDVIITYYGIDPIKKFKKECKETLCFCIYSVFGAQKKIKIQKESAVAKTPPPKSTRTSERTPVASKTKRNIYALKFFLLGMIFVCIASAVVIIMCSYIGNRNFRETFYITSSIKVDSRVRVIQISDLHGASYGKNNQKLLQRIEALAPDIILCTGDIVDSTVEDVDYAVSLAASLSEIAPSYYVYGNNEVESIYGFPLNETELDAKFGFDKNTRDESALLKIEDTFEQKLEAAGIKVLKNEKDTINVKTMTIDVYGSLTSNPSSFWSYSEKAFGSYLFETPENLKITAVHEPFIFETFAPDFWGDLMVCGHTHGGVMRVPVLGPLFTHEGGLFPERNGAFVYGRYNVQGSPLIVSSGLENSNVLRVNNQPELVIIDINKF